MPYRNVYEEQKSVRGTSEEPEKDPKKIAQIYRSQLPSNDEFEHKRAKLNAHNERIKAAYKTDRGIRKNDN